MWCSKKYAQPQDALGAAEAARLLGCSVAKARRIIRGLPGAYTIQVPVAERSTEDALSGPRKTRRGKWYIDARIFEEYVITHGIPRARSRAQ